MAEESHYDKAAADYAVGFIEYLLAKLWRRNREADLTARWKSVQNSMPSSLWGLWRSSTVKPRIGENPFGGESITYMGLDLSKKWARIESYGPKLVENITQAISRDILCYAMQTLRTMDIVAHVHDELIIECDERVSLFAVCEQMARTLPWADGLLLRADGFACKFYQKE